MRDLNARCSYEIDIFYSENREDSISDEAAVQGGLHQGSFRGMNLKDENI